MTNNVLRFDTKKVSIEEIREHYDYYMALTKIGWGLLDSGDRRGARDVLRVITNDLRLEYNYYEKAKFQDYLRKNNNTTENDYFQGIYEACMHIVNANKYSLLSSNLYDVEYYLKYWIKKHITTVDSQVLEP